jgi:dihydrofolate reductase
MQAPGRPDEDTRDGFAQGGWSAPNVDDQLLAATHARVAESGGLRLLLGRRSYEDMLGYWNTQDDPFKDALNNAPKYVASRTLREPLPWPNSTLLDGDVRAFRKRHDRPSARAEGGDGADPALVEDLRETIRVGEVPDVVWDGESPARATCEVDEVVADVRQVVSTEREDARHGVKIERRRATN